LTGTVVVSITGSVKLSFGSTVAPLSRLLTPAYAFKSAAVFFILWLVRTVIDTSPRPRSGGRIRIRTPACGLPHVAL
jgi:hypothetical protein